MTYDQVNDYLPDDAVNPEKLDQLLLVLEEQGIELIDEAEAEEARGRPRHRRVADDEVRRRDSTSASWTRSDSRRIDDPVRMYLTQMGEIPLLNRNEEISLAKKIEVTRKRFRRKVLECDYALRNVVETLKRVHCRRSALRPHRQGVAHGEPGKGQDPRSACRTTCKTLEHLMEQNVEDFNKRPRRTHCDEDERRQLRRSSADPPPQGRHAGRGTVDPHAEGPAADEEAGADLAADGRAGAADRRPRRRCADAKEDRANLEKELRDLMMHDARGAALAPRSASRSCKTRFQEYEQAKRDLSGGNLRLVVSHRQEVSQPRPELPRPDPGRQHRPDAGGGQVRISPRLQVLAPMRRGGFARRSPGPSPTRPAPSAFRCT